MKNDIEIGEEAVVRRITEVAESLGIRADEVEQHGKYIAKVPLDVLSRFDGNSNGKLIMVTAVTPTPAGEGKTVTTIGLIQGLSRIGKKVVGALREPSVGPTFGVKGGATGGGYSQVYPMWDIDLHFTGDIHAVSSAHNLLSAVLENNLVRDNPLNIDPLRVVLKKTMDMNCRELRSIMVGLGNSRLNGGVPHESGFLITSASEISAILALATGYTDLRERLERMVVAYAYDGTMVTVKDLGCAGAMMVLLKDAIKPNLVQTLEGQPVFIHGFPFANIAHGNNSVLATKYALKLGDYAVTEAGFAADLGGEKFMDIVCRKSGLSPDCVVIVASVRALMTHGGADLAVPESFTEEALLKGTANLDKHIENVKGYGVPVVVSINHFSFDDPAHMGLLRKHCAALGVECVQSDAFPEGGKGAEELARKVVEVIDRGKKDFRLLYGDSLPLKEKIRTVAEKIYGSDGVTYAPQAEKTLADLEAKGFGSLPVCIAKTQYSMSDRAELKGAPKGWTLNVREVSLSAGAGFVVPICGSMMLMPGLSGSPAALRIDLTGDGKVRGLK
ncbi:MAG: formate--tetrahydrofolate ligase [Candidatus Methanoplasma sp.]|jgi:formate--tetrahydrofolate ligase|nr:formate--tetrahydrofolate ligase [Candidatus Methanoplasma sp.]